MTKKSYGTSRVQSNLLQQNCFIRDCSLKSDIQSVNSEKKYLSLDEIHADNGVSYEASEYPYHITPDYVASFADSADYHKDPGQAVLNGVKKPNLGDVTGLQDISKMDTAQARSLYEQLSKKFAASQKSVEKSSQESVESGGNE